MSIAQRRTKLVFAVIETLVANGRTEFRHGDIASHLREQGQPLGVWEIRGELSNLEAEGLITANAATGAWQLAPTRARKTG